jgi:molybdopterin-biosynthesis enzyme MoeA-like protein
MAFGLIVIGDEILSGKRQDKHFAKMRELLAARGLKLTWVQYLADERPRLIAALRQSFASDDVVFSCGGIGATPDDHTRQAAAAALDVPLVLHAGARDLIAQHMAEINQPLTPERLRMGELPQDSELIPNPYNRIPGFSIRRHHFVPGFPVMAWPMIEWVLDTHYRAWFGVGTEAERGMIVRGLNEGTLTPLLDAVEQAFPGIRVYSLPRIDPEQRFRYEIDLGVKGATDWLDLAFTRLQAGVLELGGEISDHAGSET